MTNVDVTISTVRLQNDLDDTPDDVVEGTLRHIDAALGDQLPTLSGGAIQPLLVAQVNDPTLLHSSENLERDEPRRRRRLLQEIAARLDTAAPVADSLAASSWTLLDLLDARGAIIRLGGRLVRLGRTPPMEVVEHAMASLATSAEADLVAVGELRERVPERGAQRSAVGALFLRLGPSSQDAILWFRFAQERDASGDSDPDSRLVPEQSIAGQSPRPSVSAWRRQLPGYVAPWQEADRVIARELGDAIATATTRQSDMDPSRLRRHDPLPGLPNEQVLQERSLARSARLPVSAKGIETKEHPAVLVRCGCDKVGGVPSAPLIAATEAAPMLAASDARSENRVTPVAGRNEPRDLRAAEGLIFNMIWSVALWLGMLSIIKMLLKL